MKELFVISYVIFLLYDAAHGDSFSTIVPIDNESNNTHKTALRYGFQKTSECSSFEKSFLCIQKCLDLNFDVAYADKNCKCTCYVNKEKASYTLKYNTTRTKWKLGAPTTSIPPWAQDKKKTEETDSDTNDNHDSEHDIVDIDPHNTATPDINSATESSNNEKGTPTGLTETGTAGGSLTIGSTIGTASGSGSVNTDTATNSATGATAGPADTNTTG